jgi:hypothetical protein
LPVFPIKIYGVSLNDSPMFPTASNLLLPGLDENPSTNATPLRLDSFKKLRRLIPEGRFFFNNSAINNSDIMRDLKIIEQVH